MTIVSRSIRNFFYLLVAITYCITTIIDYIVNKNEYDVDKIKNSDLRKARYYMTIIAFVVLVLAFIDIGIYRRRLKTKTKFYCNAEKKKLCENYKNKLKIKQAVDDAAKKAAEEAVAVAAAAAKK